MSTATLADLLAMAEEAGIGTWSPPDGNADLIIAAGSGGKTKNGDPSIGLQFKVEGGPDNGKSFWTNYNLIAVKKDGESNAKGLAITFRDLDKMGAPTDVVAGWSADDKEKFTEQITDALVGNRINADIQTKVNGDFTNINLRKIKRNDGPPAQAPQPTAAPAETPPATPTF